MRRVSNQNGNQKSVASLLSKLSVPKPPTNLTVIGVAPIAVGLSWSPVPGATSYQVLQSSGSNPPTTATTVKISDTSVLVTGLTPSTTYQFRVVSVDPVGRTGPPSPPVMVMTPSGAVVNPLGP